jgi:uncharacterized protein (DUF2235 family)
MKRIIICCDGTWNAPNAPSDTHVERLAKSIQPIDDKGVAQLVLYYPGVGEGRGPTWINRAMDRVLGGAFGLGLLDNIKLAYRDLILNFDPGDGQRPSDEIFIFGFSRGAFTARSLCGLMRVGGIPAPNKIGEIDSIIAQYMAAKGKVDADDVEMMQMRAKNSPAIATSDDDMTYRMALPEHPSHVQRLKIDYMGVWDTVGGLGLPGMLGWVARIYNQRYAFHDTLLSRSARGARHALAIDEMRKLYPHTEWANLADLNGPDAQGFERPYQQQWFPGTHSIVGGSGGVMGLGAASFLFVLEGARQKGLRLDAEILAHLEGQIDAEAEATGFKQAGIFGKIPFLVAPRANGPEFVEDVSDVAQKRVRALKTYRPKTLKKVLGKILP